MPASKSRIPLAILNVVGFVAVVAVNMLAVTLPLGGKTTRQLSDQYPNLFVPSGITFSIWGLIYILLAIYVVYGLIRAVKKSDRQSDFADRIGVFFIVTCVANIGWIFSWHYELLPLSLVLMIVLLLSLIAIYRRLNVGRSTAPAPEKYLVHLPMSVYLGWISIATIANVTALLVAYKWNGFGIGEEFWTVLVMAVGAALALIALFSRRDVFYAAVAVWAFVGILIKRTSESGAPAQAVVVASIAGICLLTAGILAQIARGKVYR
jgi:hypothetical protein